MQARAAELSGRLASDAGPCGCGRPMPVCPFWSKLRDRVRWDQDSYAEYVFRRHPVLSKPEGVDSAIARGLLLTSIGVGPWIWGLAGKAGRQYSQLHMDSRRVVSDIQQTSQFIDGFKSFARVSGLIAAALA